VLVIDDELVLARTIERILAEEHDVTVEIDARAALARLLAGERYDVILCDLMMPDLTGMELLATLASAAPAVAERVTLMTGGAFSKGSAAFLASVTNPTLPKPFTAEVVRAHVRKRVS
jgi:CheY-like chemotaxis protein